MVSGPAVFRKSASVPVVGFLPGWVSSSGLACSMGGPRTPLRGCAEAQPWTHHVPCAERPGHQQLDGEHGRLLCLLWPLFLYWRRQSAIRQEKAHRGQLCCCSTRLLSAIFFDLAQPSRGLETFAAWCNGSTAASGAACLGSNPSAATIFPSPIPCNHSKVPLHWDSADRSPQKKTTRGSLVLRRSASVRFVVSPL